MPTSRRKLTDKFVKALSKNPAPKGTRVIHWDTEVKHFGVQVTDTGHYSFIVQARWGGGDRNSTRRRIDVETLAAARATAREWLDVARKADPKKLDKQRRDEEKKAEDAAKKVQVAEEKRRANTFGKMAEAWFLVIRKAGQRKAHDAERDVRRAFGSWWEMPVTDITGGMISTSIRSMRQKIEEDSGGQRDGGAHTRNVLGYVRRMFKWATRHEEYGLAVSPAANLVPLDLVGGRSARDRVLTDAELRALWNAASHLRNRDPGGTWYDDGYPHCPLIRLLILSGQRKSEVAEARWREFDLDKKLWTIPAERMKTKSAHVVPLTGEMISIIESLPRFERMKKRPEDDYVFSTTDGARPVNSFDRVKKELDKHMTVALSEEARASDTSFPGLAHWTIHDIRRTMRTNLSALPIEDRVCELMISHTQRGMHKVYDLYAYVNERRRGFELWGAHLRSILQRSPPDNVVRLAARRRVGEPRWSDDEWPVGMMPNGELRIVDEDGDAAIPTEENE